MVLHKPYPVANESELRTADQDRRGRPTQSTPDAAAAFGRMKSAAASSGVGLIAFSGYRSPDRQRELFHNAQRRHGRLHAARWVAPPGYSEHQTGLAFDIGDVGRPEADDETVFETTAAFEWLSRRAAEFQFEMSFPPDNAQRVAYEPWHWRFVGSPAARAVFHPSPARRALRDVRSFFAAVRYQILP